MNKVLTIVISILLFGVCELQAQSWSVESESNARQLGTKKIVPEEFVLAKISDQEMKEMLWKVPMESSNSRNTGSKIMIMLVDESVDEFEIVEYSMMEPGLARKYPDFKTFYGRSTSDKYRTIRLDYTLNGVRAVISDESGKSYIDPYQTNDNEFRIIYRREDILRNNDWSCLTESKEIEGLDLINNRFAGDCMLREYRIAVAATGEYTAFHGGTVALGQAAIVTAINRVNDVYEQDVASSFNLVANNDLLVYTDAGSDPYTNNDGFAMLGENQINVDNIIETANYDIGHVFSTAGGGVASLQSLCSNSSKARGVTGQPAPVNDPFWIDYVAHEVGHQFGGNHTQNNSCNRNGTTAVEPGSASTIMGYAGICAPNVQGNSDPYFHAISIAEMTAHIMSTSCAMVSGFGNAAPVVSAVSNYTVPKSTFLVLDVTATDADMNDDLTYCWEQMDNEVATMPPVSTNNDGPAFRSINPSADSKRYLPNISAIVANTTPTWEVLPSVARTMNWRVTVRDHFETVGCTDETDMVITVDGSSGPFLVNNGSIPSTVLEGENITLIWDVAGTDVAPVNCANVDVFMSTDGGLTYPITLLSNVINDGTETFVVPAGLTTTARVMVKCSDNIFFDINDSDFEVQVGGDGFTIDLLPAAGEVCNNENIMFDVNVNQIGNYNNAVTLSITGLPGGSMANFSTNPVTPGGTSMVTLSNFGSNEGSFTLDVIASFAGDVRTKNYLLELYSPTVAPTLIAPANNATEIILAPTLTWTSVPSALTYEYELRTGPSGGGNLIETASITTNMISINTSLMISTQYYWRVRSINNCGPSSFSSDFTFTTGQITEVCETFLSNETPKTILRARGGSETSTVVSVPVAALNKIVTDVNVIDVSGTHNNVGDLAFVIVSGQGTQLTLYDFLNCGNVDDFDMGFDDESTATGVDCPPNVNNTYQPEEALSLINGENANGNWLLGVFNFGNTVGSLTNVAIEVCYDEIAAPCDLTVTSTNSNGPGTLLDAVSCANSGDEIIINSGINSIIDLGSSPILITKNLIITANPLDNIVIKYSGAGSALEVTSSSNLTLEGINIEQDVPPKKKKTILLNPRRK